MDDLCYVENSQAIVIFRPSDGHRVVITKHLIEVEFADHLAVSATTIVTRTIVAPFRASSHPGIYADQQHVT
jgi:hypothetical protein